MYCRLMAEFHAKTGSHTLVVFEGNAKQTNYFSNYTHLTFFPSKSLFLFPLDITHCYLTDVKNVL
jgi:hypothetical protein